MNVDFKHVTYNKPIENDEQAFKLIQSRNRSAYCVTVSNFVYDAISKTIYDAIYCDTYRTVMHEDIMAFNGFDFKENMEPEHFIRFEFNTTGYYKENTMDLGTYTYNELGIPGLKYTGMYYVIPKYQERVNILKSYDLDIIESYLDYLKREQAEIRRTEINLNLSKMPRPRRRRFPNLPPYKKPNIKKS